MTVLQTIALPFGYSAIRMARGRVSKADGLVCQYLDFQFNASSGSSGLWWDENGLFGIPEGLGCLSFQWPKLA